MPSFADSIFLFVLALLLFGPKKLPVLARELGKWMGEFRRASNEFKMQMEEELRASEQADRQKQIAAMEAAAPVPPPLGEPAEPEHPHLRNHVPEVPTMLAPEPAQEAAATSTPSHPANFSEASHPEQSAHPLQSSHPEQSEGPGYSAGTADTLSTQPPPVAAPTPSVQASSDTADGTRPIPIATSGNLKMMPPATGLPTPRSSRPNPIASLVDSIPETAAPSSPTDPANVGLTGQAAEAESIAHGD